MIGNDLSTPRPEYRFPGLMPGDRWCVTAVNWLKAYEDGRAAPVVMASTHERTLEVVPLEAQLQVPQVQRIALQSLQTVKSTEPKWRRQWVLWRAARRWPQV